MKATTWRIGLAVVVLGMMAGATGQARGGLVVNGSFETGLTGWVQINGTADNFSSVTLHNNNDGGAGPTSFAPTEGNQFARLKTGAADTHITLQQTFSASEGDILSFDVFFDGGDYAEINMAGGWGFDFGRAFVIDPEGGWTFLFTMGVSFDESATTVAAFGASPWTSISHTLASSGDYTLGFEVVNFRNQYLDSYLGVDNVQLTTAAVAAVPEPTTLAGGLLGVALMGSAWLRRRRKVA